MGRRNYWVCLDAPTDDYTALYPEGSAIEKKLEAMSIEEVTEEIVPGGEKAVHTMIWLGVLIAAVVAVSLVLLGKLKKKQL